MPNSLARPRLQRATWSSILEHDIDFLLLDLLHTSKPFRDWLLSTVAHDLVVVATPTEFSGAWHSVGTPTGESDIEAEWHLGGQGALVVLVEDKLGAAFQPDQGLRYMARAREYVVSGRATVTRTVLVAPASYPSRDPSGAAPFEHHLSLEALAAWCRSPAGGERGQYLGAFLEHALSRYAPSRRTAGVDGERGGKPQYPGLYEIIERELAADGSSPRLRITNSSPGEWVYVRFEGIAAGVSLRWRLRDHWTELVVQRKTITCAALEQALKTIPLPGAAVAERGKTECVVWVATPEVDALAPPESQASAISQALTEVRSLANWFVSARDELHTPTKLAEIAHR